jgi:hypothetical protein
MQLRHTACRVCYVGRWSIDRRRRPSLSQDEGMNSGHQITPIQTAFASKDASRDSAIAREGGPSLRYDGGSRIFDP